MKPEVRRRLDAAHEALDTARHNLSGGFLAGAVNRAYYACFNTARAALLARGEAPKTHKGVRARFGQRFVAPGLVAPDVARVLGQSADVRETADYDDADLLEAGAVDTLIQAAARFVAAVEPLLAENPSP
jgi:uncharacterized protein (UPF0332 family)